MLKGIRDVLFVLSFRQNVPAPWQPEEAAVQLGGNCLPYSLARSNSREPMLKSSSVLPGRHEVTHR